MNWSSSSPSCTDCASSCSIVCCTAAASIVVAALAAVSPATARALPSFSAASPPDPGQACAVAHACAALLAPPRVPPGMAALAALALSTRAVGVADGAEASWSARKPSMLLVTS